MVAGAYLETLDSRVYHILKRFNKIACNKCKKNLLIGVKVVRHSNGHRNKWYHIQCAKRLNII